MSAKTKKILIEKEYLAIERAAETKSEFYNGEMFSLARPTIKDGKMYGLAGTTAKHSDIVANISAILFPNSIITERLNHSKNIFWTLKINFPLNILLKRMRMNGYLRNIIL